MDLLKLYYQKALDFKLVAERTTLSVTIKRNFYIQDISEETYKSLMIFFKPSNIKSMDC